MQGPARLKVFVAARVVLLGSIAIGACRSRPQEKFVALGRGALSSVEALSIIAVTTAPETMHYDGKRVAAGPGHQYVLLDCRFTVSPNEVNFDDFQLVQDSAATIGQELNVGDNQSDDYYYWTYLDNSGRPVADLPGSVRPFTARLSFKVPGDAQIGYLFYSGLYWGPAQFHANRG